VWREGVAGVKAEHYEPVVEHGAEVLVHPGVRIRVGMTCRTWIPGCVLSVDSMILFYPEDLS